MRIMCKSVKVVISIALVVQFISFANFAATSTFHQKEAIEFVENIQFGAANHAYTHNIFHIDERKFEISSHFSSKSSHRLAVFGKVCFIKHQKQSFRFINTVKNSLLAKLLPHLYYDSSKTSS